MTNVDFAKLLGKHDALEVSYRIELVKKKLLAAGDLSSAEKKVEEILSDVYYSSKAMYPQLFIGDTGDTYRQSLADNLRRLGYLPHSAYTPTPA